MKDDHRRDFGLIYRENAIYIYRFLLKLGCPPCDAEDITQETFVKALLNIRSFRGECSLSVWLCEIAKNTYYTHKKRRSRENAAENIIPDAADGFAELLDIVDRLPEPYRDVFIKKELVGWEYGELAAKYGKSESWARVTYYRARRLLQQHLSEGGEEK